MKAKLRELGPVLALALIPAVPLLLGGGMVNTRAGGDSPFLLIRVHQLVQNLEAGIIPARWMPQAAYGLGFPFFNFYASLPYYLAATFKLAGLGYIASVQATQVLGFVLSALFMYGLCREMWPDSHLPNLLASVAYCCAPYHLVNVYVRGDSLSEFYAFVFYPLILWALLRLRKHPSLPHFVLASLSVAGLAVTHNISALTFAPAAVLYALWLAWRARSPRSVALAVASLVAGLAAAAWFLLPALLERDQVYLRDMTTGYFHYAQHFRSWNVVQGNPVFDYGITANRQPFAMGLLQAVLAVAGALALWRQRHRGGLDPQAPFGLILAGLSTFMITPLSRPLWDLVPLLPLVQFPWRFLSMQALATSLLVCPLAQALNDGATVDAQRRGRAISVLLGAALVSSSLLGLRPERLHISEADVSIERFLLYEYFTANVGTTIRTDYLPALVEPRPFTSEVLLNGGVKPAPLALEGTLRSAELRRQEPTSESWTIEVSSPTSVLAFHTYYYPGWQATVDGHPATIEPLAQLGYIGLRLPEGIHEISLNLGRTRAQRTGEIISVATLTLLVAGLAAANRHRLRTRHYAAILVGLGLLAAPLLLGRRGPGDDFLGPPSLLGLDREAREGLDLTMDFDRAPYLHHNPSGLSFGGQATLTSYEMSTDTVHAGEGLSLTLHWNGVGTGELSALVQLVSPTKHLLGVPLTLSEHSQAITGHETVHRVETPDNLPRGIYFLTVQAANPSGAVQPVNPLGETLGTTYLTPVRVDSHVRAPDAIPALASFGERIDLLSAETEQTDAADLQVLLLWRARSNPVQNYKIALRMRDRSGTTVAALDTQPGYGFYPTSMWRPGELVHDQYLLPIEAGTPPGTDYSLQVTLYDAMTITPIGTAETAGVVVTQPTVGELPPPVHRFGSDLSLTRASLGRSEIEQGDDLAVNLQWGAIGPIGLDYACQIVLLDESGQVKVRTEEQIVKGFPASHWPQGAMVNDQRMVPLAPDLPEGVYTVRLTVTQSELALQVGSFDFPQLLHVLATDRQYQIPPMQTAVGADFGGQVRLLGYDLEKAGQHVQLKLHWQALAQMPHPYKVFVHLFAPQTEEILAQQDIVAGGESYPTTRWAPYEVVTDTVVLDLNQVPSGTYALAVGLYNRDARLAVEAPGGFTVSSNRLLLEQELPVP